MDDLEGRVHGQHRHADIQHRDAAVGHILGDGAAAAQIQTTQLTDLPCHIVGVQQTGDVAYQLGVGVAGRALAAAAGVLEESHAAACIGAVLRLKGTGPGRVVGGGNIGGQADAVLAMGTESALSPLFIQGLASAHALSTNNENPQQASRPFDKDRDGFVIGEGGGALIIETEENAKKRGAKIYAELAGFSNCTDGYHVTSPHPEGIGAVFCMEKAIEHAGITKESVDYINTHGTSTGMGDPIETNAIAELFSEHAGEMAVTSTKGATGHMMGAGGITEAITCIQCIRTGVVPPTLNLDELDEKCASLNYVPHKAIEKEVRVAMSNSFGFGGQNSSVIFCRYE